MSTRTLNSETTAEAYLELLKDRGIEVFLGNAGTDFASLVEAFARFESQGGRAPRPMVVPHEFVAVSMAHGYYAAGGKPAAVMVHVNVGTGNASTAIITATACPSFLAGSNFQVFTFSMTFSSRPIPKARGSCMSRTRPSGPTTHRTTTVP